MLVYLLATEGPSDQKIISEILFTYLEDDNLLIQARTPIIQNKAEMEGGWAALLNYLTTSDFRGAFSVPDSVVIIQIDTDVSEHEGFNVSWRTDDGAPRTPEELIEAVRRFLVEKIGTDFYEIVKDRIVFAICVHSIECWFLPLYFPNDKSKRTKPENCLRTLNQKLSTLGYTIDAKSAANYDKLCRCLKKKKDVESAAVHQVSLKVFLDQLDELNVTPE